METHEPSIARIPGAVVRRLPKYLTQAQQLRQQGAEWVSSSDLAEALGLTSSTVRQDLSHIDFQGISKRGYSIIGLETALANSPSVIGKKVGRFVVQDIEELPTMVRDQKVELGIVSVPHEAAQSVADGLIHAGIRGLLNLTTAHLIVPGTVSVVDARILASLRELAYAVRSQSVDGEI